MGHTHILPDVIWVLHDVHAERRDWHTEGWEVESEREREREPKKDRWRESSTQAVSECVESLGRWSCVLRSSFFLLFFCLGVVAVAVAVAVAVVWEGGLGELLKSSGMAA